MVYPSTANFHLLKLSAEYPDPWQLKDQLLVRNILIRTPEGFEGLDGQFLRCAVKDRISNDKFIEQFGDIFIKK